jgi:serine/threonine protein kinase
MIVTHHSLYDIVGDRYKLIKLIGSGSNSTIYQAVHIHSNEDVAIKIIPIKQSGGNKVIARFLRETKFMQSLKHAGIVKIIDAWIEKDRSRQCYLVMELLQGMNLRELWQSQQCTRKQSLKYIVQILDPLILAHDQGIVHRDIKPENIFLHHDAKTNRHQIKLLDFGLSRNSFAPNITQKGEAIGTPWYMSPEQAFSAKDCLPAADIWALGIILYEALSDQVPFKGDSIPMICMSIKQDMHVTLSDLKPSVPHNLSSVVDECLIKEPNHRILNAHVLKDQIITSLDPFLHAAVAEEYSIGESIDLEDDSFSQFETSVKTLLPITSTRSLQESTTTTDHILPFTSFATDNSSIETSNYSFHLSTSPTKPYSVITHSDIIKHQTTIDQFSSDITTTSSSKSTQPDNDLAFSHLELDTENLSKYDLNDMLIEEDHLDLFIEQEEIDTPIYHVNQTSDVTRRDHIKNLRDVDEFETEVDTTDSSTQHNPNYSQYVNELSSSFIENEMIDLPQTIPLNSQELTDYIQAEHERLSHAKSQGNMTDKRLENFSTDQIYFDTSDMNIQESLELTDSALSVTYAPAPDTSATYTANLSMDSTPISKTEPFQVDKSINKQSTYKFPSQVLCNEESKVVTHKVVAHSSAPTYPLNRKTHQNFSIHSPSFDHHKVDKTQVLFHPQQRISTKKIASSSSPSSSYSQPLQVSHSDRLDPFNNETQVNFNINEEAADQSEQLLFILSVCILIVAFSFALWTLL